MSKSFSGNPRYRLVFQNTKGFNIGLNLIIIPASVSTLGKGRPEGMDVHVDAGSDAALFRRCAVNNAAYDYYSRCMDTDMDISEPPKDLRIWIFPHLTSSSACMLHHGAFLSDDLLSEYFEKNEVAAGYPNIPYCDVIDTKGSVVTFMNRDSLYREQYKAARETAKNLTNDDIYPLVTIEEGSDMASMSGDNTQVILVTWHNNPDRFKDGELTTLKDGEVLWAYTDKEFLKWFRENHEKVDNWDLRLKQLLGMSPETNNSHFTVFWANVSDVFRPAYYPEINSGLMNTTFSNSLEEDTSENAMWFKNWFDRTSDKAYGRNGFPWTRLGYTYDWGNPSSKYGLSEFIVKEGATIEVKFTRNNKAFLKWNKDRM
jgi:hypothetical protein